MPKLDRLARSVPDARSIADELAARGVTLALGQSRYDPTDPMGKMFFNILATFAEFEADLIRLRTREGMKIAHAKGSDLASWVIELQRSPSGKANHVLSVEMARTMLTPVKDGYAFGVDASVKRKACNVPLRGNEATGASTLLIRMAMVRSS